MQRMSELKSFKQLQVWQRSMELVKEIYELTADLPPEEKYGLTSQIRRCAISIPSNIAEGFKRRNPAEYRQFLAIAAGSAAEVETQLILTKELFAADTSRADELLLEVQKMLSVLIKKLSPTS
jgi:four helix bundle protein